MDDEGEQGAIAAAKYFIGLYEYSHGTGDLEAWEAMSLHFCEFCVAAASNIREIYEAGGYEDMGEITFVGEPTTNFINGVNAWEVTYRIKIAPTTIYDADGAVTREFPRARNKLLVGLVRMYGTWRVQGLVASDDE